MSSTALRFNTPVVGAGHDPLLSIVMVAYNSKSFLDQCFLSIKRFVSVNYEIVVLDNGSTDGTSQYLHELYPDVRLIESDRNLGFACGNNRAAELSRGKYLLLLNCDTILLSDVVSGIDILERDSRVGIVGARMFGAEGESRPSTGHFPTPWRLWKISWLWSSPHSRPFGDPALRAFRHDWVEGSFLLTSRENWLEVHGMNEDAFMYVEDVEFCAHTLHRGRVTVQCSDLKYVHFGGFDGSRTAFLYAGYRRFHATSSGAFMRLRAQWVLLLGLGLRLALFGLLAVVTGKKRFRDKFGWFREVALRWNELAPRLANRAPSVNKPRLT